MRIGFYDMWALCLYYSNINKINLINNVTRKMNVYQFYIFLVLLCDREKQSNRKENIKYDKVNKFPLSHKRNALILYA